MAQEISIRQSLSRAYKNIKVQRSELSLFYDTLRVFLRERDVDAQDEEYNKKLIDKFLTKAFYADSNAINTNNPTDLVIFADATAKGSRPVVLFEVKMPGNDEMVRRDDLNRKALHELVLYYIREEERQHNTYIKHLVITDGLQWFFFDKQVFYDCFVAKKTFCSKVLEADREKNKTNYIFQKIIAPHVASLKDDELRFCYLNLADVAKLSNEQALKSRALENAYKLLSPVFLLKRAVMVDHNELNEEFYLELLYIMGLEEIMQDGVAKIVRCAPSRRHRHSLMEETMFALEARSDIATDEECEDVALGLVLTWVNRLLFLKLLEAQLMDFNGEEFRKFLTPDRISSFSILNDLFIHVLAQPVEERVEEMADKFEDLPYLNSSLFEYTPLELQYFSVSQLYNGRLKIFRRTRIHDEQRRLMRGEKPVLEYLLRFLDAYDFSGMPIDKEDEEEQKTIINAAVLGVIFEKINGYKDGAFFTPSYLSEYICRETIRRTVVDRFNKHYGWTCGSYEELVNRIDTFDRFAIDERDKLINSIRICDPSVGSGHFLVSALNELLLIKYDLNCLLYYDSYKRIVEYAVAIEDGELVLRNTLGKIVKYDPKSEKSTLLQKSLFEEKRTLIENCLFGVDLNPKSVEICRLRLWIELLKNTYYEKGALQTLPNIDCNIRCGNSLISKYPVHVGRSAFDNHLLEQLERYKQLTEEYKNCDVKRRKWAMMREREKLLASPMVLDQQQRSLFNVSNAVVMSAMDWMTQFPEMLDENGSFLGFDIVIGNPPYINMQSLPDMTAVYEKLIQPVGIDSHQVKPLYETYTSTGDICSLFFERGLQLLKPEGRLCFVTTNKWLRTGWGENTRRFLVNNTNPQLLVDFPKLKLFKKATVEVCVLMFTRVENRHKLKACTVAKKEDSLYEYVQEHLINSDYSDCEPWVIKTVSEKRLFNKIIAKSKPLIEWGVTINRGVATGNNDAFIISSRKYTEIVNGIQYDTEAALTKEVLCPVLQGRDISSFSINWDGRRIVATFPARHLDIELMPSVKRHLLEFAHDDLLRRKMEWIEKDFLHDYCQQKLAQKGAYIRINGYQLEEKGRKATFYKWFETQDSGKFWTEFSKPKIVWGEISDKPKFAFDEEGRYYCEATTFFMTGEHLVYLLVYLNSPLSAYLFSKLGTTTGAGTKRWKKYKVEQQLVPSVTPEDEERINDLYHQYVDTQDKSLLDAAYHIIYNNVGLTPDEVEIINQQADE